MKHTEKHKRKISLSLIGNTNGFKKGHKIRLGVKHTKETKERISKANKGKISWAKGKKFTKEHKKKLSKAHIGNKNSLGYRHTEEAKRKLSEVNIGKHHSEKTKEKISELLKKAYKKNPNLRQQRRESFIGENNPNWKGGISTENDKARHNFEINLWKKAVLVRDNFTCQKYDVSGGKLCVHHINNFAEFSELRTAIDNGITLSEKAHKEFHKIYGYKNNTKEQLTEFLSRSHF